MAVIAEPPELLADSAGRIAGRIARRELSATEVMQAHLARIGQVNGILNAVVAMDAERALREAAEVDRRLALGDQPRTLTGVPVTIKDSFDTDGLVSTAGTAGRRSHVPAHDATVVQRLRRAGAIVVGKTNTPELTMGSSTENSVYGRTLNPYDLAKSPAGSSGGSVAIVAAGGSALDIGSDTGGSIRNPAHVCGLAGLKPTVGRVPLTGHVVSFDFGFLGFLTQAGPIARWVDDLALALAVIAGPDDIDPLAVPVPLPDLQRRAETPLRVAWFTGNGHVSADAAVAATTRAAVAALADAGAVVSEAIPPLLAEIEEIYGRLRDADGAHCITSLLNRCGTAVFSERMRVRIARATPLDGAGVANLFERMYRLSSGMLAFMQQYDVLVCPPAVHPAQTSEELANSTYEDWVFQTAFNVTGWPAAVVRAGQTPEGLPVGVQIAAKPWREDLVLATARLIEEALGGYVPPKLVSSGMTTLA
ncbi:MAG: amidase [Dongiaceae bacterium]